MKIAILEHCIVNNRLARLLRFLRRHMRWSAMVCECLRWSAMVCDGLRWSAMLLEPQNRRKMAHFIAMCGRAYRHPRSSPPRHSRTCQVCSFVFEADSRDAVGKWAEGARYGVVLYKSDTCVMFPCLSLFCH